VLNRGNARQDVFHKDGDFAAFLKLIGQSSQRLPMRLLAYCLLTNHFHLVVWPFQDGDLSRWMQWLTTSHVRRYHRHYKSTGHVWQGRFKSFPIEQEDHLLNVLRYVERNPVRAGLVESAQDWPWSSVGAPPQWASQPALHAGPVPRGANWIEYVNQPQTEAELAALRHSVSRGTPYGSQVWQKRVAKQLGLESTMRARGRPTKKLRQ